MDFHMAKGAGESSYANNSEIPRSIAMKTMPVLEESIKEVYNELVPECLMMADLGCSSGPNALLVVWKVINILSANCRINENGEGEGPQLGVFLSDLPSNDFNNLFSLLPNFYNTVERISCFVSGTPGSFYGRLFPNQFLHFVHSCCALHWLSRVPQGLLNEKGVGLNKGRIFIANTSPPEILEAYYSQFKRDFTMFLSSRGKEMVHGGCMVLTFLYRIHRKDPYPIFDLIGSILNDMVLEGVIEEEKLDNFNLPFYSPTIEEVRELVDAEGSFSLNKVEKFSVKWNVNLPGNIDFQAQLIAKHMRAVLESLLSTTFHKETLDILFYRLQTKVKESMACQKCEHLNVVISMNKRS